jgi:hypothetical protein
MADPDIHEDVELETIGIGDEMELDYDYRSPPPAAFSSAEYERLPTSLKQRMAQAIAHASRPRKRLPEHRHLVLEQAKIGVLSVVIQFFLDVIIDFIYSYQVLNGLGGSLYLSIIQLSLSICFSLLICGQFVYVLFGWDKLYVPIYILLFAVVLAAKAGDIAALVQVSKGAELVFGN